MGTQELFNLSGRTALVTGASRGIGKAIALALAEAGAGVAVHCASRRAEAERVAEEAAGFGVRSGVVAADFGEPGAARRAFDAAVELLGRVDILVSNASVQIPRPWQEVTGEEFERQVRINWQASWELMQAALPGMIERRWGRVVAVGSVQQTVPSPMMVIYAGTKAAQLNMARNLARQVARHGVTVNNLAPGVIDTERNAGAMNDPEHRERIRRRIPVGFIGQPEDCVGAALILCSEAGRYITGADLAVDGGWGLP